LSSLTVTLMVLVGLDKGDNGIWYEYTIIYGGDRNGNFWGEKGKADAKA